MDIDWPYVRQIILNDRVNGYKPDKECIREVGRLLPDVKVLGFGKYYLQHWYLLIESKSFSPSIEPIECRQALPRSSLSRYLA